MEILKFVSGLLPQFGKDRMEEDLRIVRTELETITIPAFVLAEEVFGKPLQSKEGQAIEKSYKTSVGSMGRAPSMVVSIREKLQEIVPVLAAVESAIEKDFDKEVFVAGLTLRKANVLRMLELSGFISTFSLRLLNYLYIIETSEAGSNPGYVADSMSPGEIKRIKGNIFEFCLALKALAQPKEKIQKTLDSIPEVLVNAKGQAALSAFTGDKLDPLGLFNVQGFTYNPIYHIGMMVAEYQFDRYKRARELKSVLELRMLHLQKVRDDNTDPGVEREITVIQGRIDNLSERIRKFEESAQ